LSPERGLRNGYSHKQRQLRRASSSGNRNLPISRVENGHTVPAIETLEKMARALEVPLYHIMYDGDEPPKEQNHADDNVWGSHGKDRRYLHKICGCLSRMSDKG
jgi:transcriptional regulator with XRE-family HTH domain